jgi:hypothetical protein
MKWLRAWLFGISSAMALVSAAVAQEAPTRFDLTCDAKSVDGINAISTSLRFAVDLDAASMRPYRNGRLEPAVTIKVTEDRIILRDEDQAPFGDFAKVHVRETLDRRTGAFESDMDFVRKDGEALAAKAQGQCALTRYTGGDGKPLY